jgi:hypothetical protein
MAAGQRLPQDHADGPDVAALRRLLAGQALRGDVRERPRDVADRGQRVRLVELREAEVEDPDRDPSAFLDEHVRRLDVPVDDAAAVRVCEPVEHLGANLDGLRVGELARAELLAERAATHVLVRDVDVSPVAAEVVRAHAALVSKPRRSLHLAGCPSRALPLTGDDLERDVQPGALVARQPDRP